MADTILPVKVAIFPGERAGKYMGRIDANDGTPICEMEFNDAVMFAAAVNLIGPALTLLGQCVPYIQQVADTRHQGAKDTLAAIDELGRQWNEALWGEEDA